MISRAVYEFLTQVLFSVSLISFVITVMLYRKLEIKKAKIEVYGISKAGNNRNVFIAMTKHMGIKRKSRLREARQSEFEIVKNITVTHCMEDIWKEIRE